METRVSEPYNFDAAPAKNKKYIAAYSNCEAKVSSTCKSATVAQQVANPLFVWKVIGSILGLKLLHN